MSYKSRSRLNLRLGGILAISVAGAFVMIGMLAMVTDVGFVYYSQSRLQTAVNAGWKAGYDKMVAESQNQSPPAPDVQTRIIGHIKEVMKANNYTDAELASLTVDFGPRNFLRVHSQQKVGLFFARVFDLAYSNVQATRQNHQLDVGQGVVPLAIPHGVIKDYSRNSFGGELFGSGSGFKEGQAYILKLGSGAGQGPDAPPSVREIAAQAGLSETDPLKMLYIPMMSGQAQPLKAYGVVFWCLRWGNDDPGTYVPVYWLIGNKADGGPDGSFLTFSNQNIKDRLNAAGVTYNEIDENLVENYINAATRVETLVDRPKVAVYSNTGKGWVASILEAANIPYGAYSMTYRNDLSYLPAQNTLLNDAGMVGGLADSYHVILTEGGENLTGMHQGCASYTITCEEQFYNKRLAKATKDNASRLAAENLMCPSCRNYYRHDLDFDIDKNFASYETMKNLIWSTGGVLAPSQKDIIGATGAWQDARNNCQFKNRRCADRVSGSGVPFFLIPSPDPANPLMCGDAATNCRSYTAQWNLAAAFATEFDNSGKPQLPPQNSDQTFTLDPAVAGWFVNANRLQKMKWSIAEKLRAHVFSGGHLVATGFTAETLDLGLYQSAINKNSSPYEDNCMAFSGISFKQFPFNLSWYSSINALVSGTSQAFTMYPYNDMRTQVNGSANTHSAITNAFASTKATVLGRITNTQIKYLSGTLGTGEFCYIGGSVPVVDTEVARQSCRMLLNNILRASLSTKEVTGGNNTPLAGKQKANFGPIDPDNVTGGGASDYEDRFKFGFNGPLEINDRLITETGNMRGPTDSAVDFRINGDATHTPSTRIIVPITDVPPEAQANQPKASTVYHIQGKDHPNGAYTLDEYDFQSSIRIIGFAEFELISADDPRARSGTNYLDGDAGDLGPYQAGQVRAIFIRYVVKPGDIPLS